MVMLRLDIWPLPARQSLKWLSGIPPLFKGNILRISCFDGTDAKSGNRALLVMNLTRNKIMSTGASN